LALFTVLCGQKIRRTLKSAKKRFWGRYTVLLHPVAATVRLGLRRWAAGCPAASRRRVEDRPPQDHPGPERAPGEERQHLLFSRDRLRA